MRWRGYFAAGAGAALGAGEGAAAGAGVALPAVAGAAGWPRRRPAAGRPD